jgi:DNA-binding FadR family transcriptional regulator
LIAPGEALPPERELAAMFGVGRPTVQRALKILEGEHLVEARRGRSGGTFVLRPTEDSRVMDELITRLLRRRHELLELLDHRRVLEPAIARMAATSRRSADLHRIRRALDGMASAQSEPDNMYFDTEFHIATADATRNRFLSQAVEQIRMDLNDVLSLLPESEVWHRRLAGEHQAIFAAIESGDADASEVAAATHVTNSDTGARAVLTAIRRSTARGAGR